MLVGPASISLASTDPASMILWRPLANHRV